MAGLDPHSYCDDTQPEVASIDWRAEVDFTDHRLSAEVGITLREAGEGPIDLDTRDLIITAVTDDKGTPLPFTLAAPEPILGSRLRVTLPAGTRRFEITYTTSPTASALQFLGPEQTAGRVHPFLFSQCQAIHTRSVVPLQDTPRVRIRYRAELTVPRALQAVMAARFVDRNEGEEVATVHFQMDQPIPPYLFAFAVGDLAARDIGPRSRVWAEPSLVDKAAWEFDGVENMIARAESLFGSYDWQRFDILVLPPSFPYGGMENPRLTFLTPTLLAGDRSLVNVVAHELAHSWTGNLVTNASAEHFWLNEGFTVFAERRIVEALDGVEVAALHAALGRRELDKALGRFVDHPEYTRLHTHLTGIDPDDVFSEVPYEKGYLFLRAIEESVGREAFDKFLAAYIGRFRFRSITSDDFVALLEEQLPGAFAKVNGKAWLEEGGLPARAPQPRSARLDALAKWSHDIPPDDVARGFSPTEWQLYLSALPHPWEAGQAEALDARFALTKSGNYEVLVAWLGLAVSSGYAPVLGRVEEVLGEVGRMKYLRPLYLALVQRPDTRPLARRAFERWKSGYHPIAQHMVSGILAKNGA